ncbi:hypothetical protein [Actinacidiphila bryophytorum]|jgi:hypothetical protein|uniref:hypothetical protein n=1 Tax=Actinacidiphila bryophytorum TaxID=1436133 RepID=UPI002176D758|nr:hypothetical protein [Actinacidiphila bryophytorum]UWE10135.1 hypothetical protein NYE86_16395 [Actinacidiphila bryophytorum]
MNRAAAHRSAARILGAALAVAACNPPRVLGAPVAGWALVLAAAGAAWWAAPMVDTRPVLSSMRWSAVAVQRRNTLLPAGAIVLAALTGPAVWLAGCVTGLLVAYLLVTDGWTMGATAPAGTDRATPALAATAAAAVVFAAATAPVDDTSWARLPAALALAATAACVALALRHRA